MWWWFSNFAEQEQRIKKEQDKIMRKSLEKKIDEELDNTIKNMKFIPLDAIPIVNGGFDFSFKIPVDKETYKELVEWANLVKTNEEHFKVMKYFVDLTKRIEEGERLIDEEKKILDKIGNKIEELNIPPAPAPQFPNGKPNINPPGRGASNKCFHTLRQVAKCCGYYNSVVIFPIDEMKYVYCGHDDNGKHYCSSNNCPIIRGLEK